MIARASGIIGTLVLLFILCIMVSHVSADNEAVLDQAKIIGIIPISKEGVTKNIYRYIDRLVPELKKLPSEQIVKLECSYIGLSERERDIFNAYQIAGRVEKYLREHHKLNLDLWIAAYIGKQTRQHPPALTFSVFSDDFRKLEMLPVDPTTLSAEKAY